MSVLFQSLRAIQIDLDSVRQLDSRAGSALINVAMFGSSSSGKSFLASGLLRGLEFLRADSVDGIASDKYLGLLPFAPTPVTTCPARIIPAGEGADVDATGRGFMRVRFIDSSESEWHDIGNTPPPAVVAAYAMEKADVTNRRPEHMYKSVAEIEILYSGFDLPAKLYDLPGYGSSNANHEQIARRATGEADCFIFVANATRSLETSAKDLELIRFLYDLHKAAGKQVIWVLTAIDKAKDLNLENEPEWKMTLAENNAYLRQTFIRGDGMPDDGFIGPGFIPVSPALEAQGRYYIGRNPVQSQMLIAESNMDELRHALMALITQGTGQQHLMRMAAEASAIVIPRQRIISATLETQRLPVDQLISERSTLERRLATLDSLSAKVTEHLGGILKTRVRLTGQSFKGFSSYLHQQLDGEIRSTNLRSEKERNKLQVRKSMLTNEWLTRSDGPVATWESQFRSFEQAALGYVHSELGRSEGISPLGDPPPLDLIQLMESRVIQRRAAGGSTLEKTALFVTAATPLSAGATWALGLAAISTVVWPAAAITAVGAMTFATLSAMRKSRSALEVEREELIHDIDSESTKIQQSLTDAYEAQGQVVIDNILEYMSDYRRELEQLLENIRQRIAEPQTIERLELIRGLEPLELTAQRLIASLSQMMSH